MTHDPTQPVLERIKAEFLEMPGLRLTPTQAARLWALQPDRCGTLLKQLQDLGFLAITPDGSFVLRQGTLEGRSRWLRRVS